MIVWGGMGNDDVIGTGARYEPAGDTWSPISVEANTPSARGRHAAVWTGSEMIVWGGEGYGSYLASGGGYCACVPATFYRDADGDGFGVSTDTVASCAAPPGYVAGAGDCEDAVASTYPGATEVKDGMDDQCPGDCLPGQADCGFGVIDEISGTALWKGSTLCWPAQAGADAYQVVRSSGASFTDGCFVFPASGATCIEDPSTPNDGVYFYLVRSVTPNPPGSWGRAFARMGPNDPAAACRDTRRRQRRGAMMLQQMMFLGLVLGDAREHERLRRSGAVHARVV